MLRIIEFGLLAGCLVVVLALIITSRRGAPNRKDVEEATQPPPGEEPGPGKRPL